MDTIISILVSIIIFAIVTFGILCGAFAFFMLYGYLCMMKQDKDDVWRSLWKGRMK